MYIKKIAAVVFLVSISASCLAQLTYPVTKKVNQSDDYFGTKVSDPYRWLEDDKSEETKRWVDAQNKVTQAYLDQILYRKQFQDGIEKVFNYPKYAAPSAMENGFIFIRMMDYKTRVCYTGKKD